MASCRVRHRVTLLQALAVLFAVILIYSIASLLQYENVFSRGYDYDELPEAPGFSVNFYRQFFDYLETPLAVCQKLARFSKSTSWEEPSLCLSEPLDMWHVSNCLVYAFHHTDTADADYAAFERGAAEHLGCQVHVFDLTGQHSQTTHQEIGAGSVTWHVVGSSDAKQPLPRLIDLVDRLGHTDRVIHHLRLVVDLDTRRGADRLPPFLRQLQQLRSGELELLGSQVAQLQLVLALRPAGLSADALSSYQDGWRLLSELHRHGFSVLESRSAGRVVWLPGLGRQVATRYNLLLGKHMPLQSRRSVQLSVGSNNSFVQPPQQVHMFGK